MKRNWLPYIAVIAALVAGSIVSTAFAGPPSFKFGNGGGNGNNSGNGNNASRNFTPRIGIPGQGTSGQNGMQAQIKKFQGNGFPGKGIGQAIGGNPNNSQPKITINPGNLNKKIGTLPAFGNGNNGPMIPKLGGNGGLGIPKIGKIDPGFNKGGNGNVAGQIVGGILGGNGNGNANCHKDIHCGPIKVGCKPWWNDCHHFHHDHCYKPSYPVCSQTIIVQVPVQEVAVVTPAMQVPVGSTLTLQSLGLGDAAGQVMLQVDKIAIPAMVNEWRPDAVTTTLPMLGLSGQVIADIVIVRADGTVANSIKVELINAQPQAAQAAAPAGAVQPAGFQADQGGAAAALGGL